MRQRGRRSSASLSVAAVCEAPRPGPPRELSREAKRLWREIAACFAPDHFCGCEFLLQQLVEVIALSRALHRQTQAAIERADDKRLSALIVMQRHAAQTVSSLSRQLRISPRSRFVHSRGREAGVELAETVAARRWQWQPVARRQAPAA